MRSARYRSRKSTTYKASVNSQYFSRNLIKKSSINSKFHHIEFLSDNFLAAHADWNFQGSLFVKAAEKRQINSILLLT